MRNLLLWVRATFIRTSLAAAAIATLGPLFCLVPQTACSATQSSAPKDYATHCASCHGTDRLGVTGPALLPESLERLRPEAAVETVTKGRLATQMPAFGEKLDRASIGALVEFLYSPPLMPPVWNEANIVASHVVYVAPSTLPAKPVFGADPLNLFVVVESGDHHATILDGDSFEPVKRFATRYALHGGPKFSPDGRYVYFASRDGWISLYDIWNLTLIAEVRAGLNTRNLAVSSDGRFVLVGNSLPHTLVLLDARDLSVLRVLEASIGEGQSSRVSAVYDAAPRKSFLAALKDAPEIWEIPYAAAAPAIPKLPTPAATSDASPPPDRFPVRRIALADVLDDFFLDPDCAHAIGASRTAHAGQVVDLDAGRTIAQVDLPGLPHLGSGISWVRDGRPVLATPNLREALVSVIDMRSWQTIAQIKTAGPGFFLRSHENTPFAWVDAFNSPSKDVLQVLDKRTLEVVATLRPSPGKTVAHVEFTRDGRYALASIWEMDGAIVVYDATTLHEVRRVPMVKPSGKYNVFNKVSRSTGTSH